MNDDIPSEIIVIAGKVKEKSASPEETKQYIDYLNSLLVELNNSLDEK